MTRVSRSLVYVSSALGVALATMGFECGPPGRDRPCTNQIVEGDVLHIELVGRYTDADGGVWAGGEWDGFGTSVPHCVGIDSLAIGATFDAKIQGHREDMLCTLYGFVPQWEAPRFGTAALPTNLVRSGGSGGEVALSDGAVLTSGGCVGLYGISLIATTSDLFANPSFTRPYGTFLKRYFRTNEPIACGADFVGELDPTGATYCGDMFLVRVTR